MKTTPTRSIRPLRVGWLVGAAVLFSIAGLLAWLSLTYPSREKLRPIEGVVTRIADASSSTKAITIIQEQIWVRDGSGAWPLRHPYLPQLRTVAVGQSVRVLAEPDIRGFVWIWEVRRGDDLLLSYEDTRAEQLRSNRFLLLPAALSALGALALLARHFKSRQHVVPNAA